jgi:hypothetical protein
MSIRSTICLIYEPTGLLCNSRGLWISILPHVSRPTKKNINIVTLLNEKIKFRTVEEKELVKQHLKIKSFIGTNENAKRIMKWAAMIAMLQ